MDRELTHLSLFSGIGGLDLAAEWAGFRTVGQCEWADYPRAVLEKHWAGLPRWRDIRTLTKESFFEKTGLHTVDVISGGFPCQPFSVAGKQRGKDDDRYLWHEMFRVIQELHPAWVIGENVPGIINLALDQVLFDLESEGYEVQCFLVPACGVDAPHKRNRVCIVAYCHRNRTREAEVQTRRNASEYDFLREVRDNDHISGVCRVDDGIRAEVHGTDTHADIVGLLRRESDKNVEREFTICTSRERERESRGYDGRLSTMVEETPWGRVGRMNPEWVEWLMGFPIGWTELNASETQ